MSNTDKIVKINEWAKNHAKVVDNEWVINLLAIQSRIKYIFNAQEINALSEGEGWKCGHLTRQHGCPDCMIIDPEKYPLADGYCPNCYTSDCSCPNSEGKEINTLSEDELTAEDCKDVYPTKWAYEQLVKHHLGDHHKETDTEIARRVWDEYEAEKRANGTWGRGIVITEYPNWLDQRKE